MLLVLAGCEDRSYRVIGAQIETLTKEKGLVDPAVARLARIGRRAIPQIETALHTASARGKTNLIGALEAIGDVEAVPILQHFATFDADSGVRSACGALLGKWAVPPDARSEAARKALARVAEKRARGAAGE
jgi:hypothetical protein